MNCFTEEQLAEAALRHVEDERMRAHVEECDACRAKLAGIRRVAEQLTAVHAEWDRSHLAGRAQLLASLPKMANPPRRTGVLSTLGSVFQGLTFGQRIAAGGLSVSTAAALVLVFVFANWGGRLSAMERMALRLREVKSYSYRLFTRDTFVKDGEKEPTTVIHTGTTYWIDPASLWYDEKLVRTEGPAFPSEAAGGLLGQFTGVHPSGARGMMIYHDGRQESMVRTYYRVPEMRADEFNDTSPIARLRMVREGKGKVLRELGTKEIDGKQARGYVMALANAAPGSGFDAVEVWADPDSFLPIEFGYEVKTDERTSVFRITDCRWNIEIDPKIFDTTPPDGYADITPPSDERDFAAIAAALKLYAELSDGHYPRVTEFHSDAVQEEMRKLAGFAGPPQAERANDKTFLAIQEARAGLDWIERILRNKYNAGYHANEVGRGDKDKALLWWLARVGKDNLFRVFYGDLRTELLPYADWAKHVPKEAVVSFAPE